MLTALPAIPWLPLVMAVILALTTMVHGALVQDWLERRRGARGPAGLGAGVGLAIGLILAARLLFSLA